MDYETKRLRIVMWTVVALLILSIVGASLLFARKMRHDNTLPNPVNVGERISRADVSLAPDAIAGAGYDTVSDDGSTSIWHGANSHSWTGSGTQADPYLITKASELYGISFMVSTGTTYAGKYFKLDINLDMNGDTLTFTPIGTSSSKYFAGNFDGDGHTISNLRLNTAYSRTGLFGYVKVSNQNITIKNLIIELNMLTAKCTAPHIAPLVCDSTGSAQYSVNITNCHTYFANRLNVYGENEDYYAGNAGGLVGHATYTKIEDCTVNDFKMHIYYIDGSITQEVGGIGYYLSNCTVNRCKVNLDAQVGTLFAGSLGGIVASGGSNSINDCYVTVNVQDSTESETTNAYCRFAGITCNFDSTGQINNCLVQGSVKTASRLTYVAGISTGLNKNSINNIVNLSFSATKVMYDAGGIFCAKMTDTTNVYNVYNSTKFSKTNVSSMYEYGATTDEDIKKASTYSNWTDFNSHWIISPKYNDGYPTLKAFIDLTFVTGFDGNGTQDSPYLIQTQQELLSVANYYNNNNNIENDVYWKLANDIVVSKDANNAFIHFTPICYVKEFDGYFDGNGKTISGLLIDNQYEYTGLFGTIGANHWVKNLTVKGNIYWDQAYAVGGVAGRVMDGGYLQNCKFDGNIIGVLNTKQSTETNGVIGKYGINGAIDCTATYTDLKYAKIGGTTDAPTYTYYLYDWARITTSLYNKKVG